MPAQSNPLSLGVVLGVVVLVLGLLVESQLALQTTCYPASATLVSLQSTDFLLELANGIQPHKVKGVSVRLFAKKPDGTTYDKNFIDMSIASLEEIDEASAMLLGYSFRNDTAAVCEVTETTALVKTREGPYLLATQVVVSTNLPIPPSRNAASPFTTLKFTYSSFNGSGTIPFYDYSVEVDPKLVKMNVDLYDFPATPGAFLRMPFRADFYFPFDASYNRTSTPEAIKYSLSNGEVTMKLDMQVFSYVDSVPRDTNTRDFQFVASDDGRALSAIQSIIWPSGTRLEYDPTLSVLFNFEETVPSEEPAQNQAVVVGASVGVVAAVVLVAGALFAVYRIQPLRQRVFPFLSREKQHLSEKAIMQAHESPRGDGARINKWAPANSSSLQLDGRALKDPVSL